MSHTIYAAKTCTFTTRKSVTCTGACANEFIPEINVGNDKVNNKNYHTVGTVPNRRCRRKIETIAHIYVLVLAHTLPKLVLWVQTSHLSLKYVSSESQSHAPAHVLMSLYQIDKSLVFITKRKKDVILEYEIFNDPHDVKE
jgi:hypothetical protein